MLRILLHAAFSLALATAGNAQTDAPDNETASESAGADVSATEASGATVPKLTADHAKFDSLKGPFATGSDVTRACLGCHTEAGKQVSHSIHWPRLPPTSAALPSPIAAIAISTAVAATT